MTTSRTLCTHSRDKHVRKNSPTTSSYFLGLQYVENGSYIDFKPIYKQMLLSFWRQRTLAYYPHQTIITVLKSLLVTGWKKMYLIINDWIFFSDWKHPQKTAKYLVFKFVLQGNIVGFLCSPAPMGPSGRHLVGTRGECTLKDRRILRAPSSTIIMECMKCCS